MTAGAARAQDDDEDDKTFEEKIIEGIMAGIGGTNMENRGIDYRERSPLVVPPKLDLPPPAATTAEVKAPNWPKDPDEARRKAAIAARKKENKDPRRSQPPPDAKRTQCRQDGRDRARQQRSGPAGHFVQQSDPQPVAARLHRRLRQSFRRQQSRDRAVQGRADAGNPDPAAARIPDAVAEFRLRHRAEGIAEQGIQPGCRQIWRIAGVCLSAS